MKNLLATVLGIAALAHAQVAKNCQGSACYSVHVPQSAASSGKGDVYFQITAPTSYSWAGFGQGAGMVGANIFVVYADSSKKNVTVSPRYAQGFEQPQHDTKAKVTLLAGSGIENGKMTANVLCTNCNSWSGEPGSMTFNDPQSGWIWAWKEGDPVASDSLSADIQQHDDMGTFTFDLTKAAGGADSTNPFVTDSGSPTTPSSPASSSSSSGSSSSSSSSSSSGGDDDDDSSEQMRKRMITAHGTIMGLTMVLLFPMGAAIRRLAPASSIWLHAGWQTVAYLLAVAGMGIGVWVALDMEQLMDAHPIIGLVVVAFMSFQFVSGLLQHAHYKKHGTRSVAGWGHQALGVGLILLGIVNGGLGLQLAMNSTQAEIAYGVIAGVVGLGWLALMLFGAGKKRTGAGLEKRNSA